MRFDTSEWLQAEVSRVLKPVEVLKLARLWCAGISEYDMHVPVRATPCMFGRCQHAQMDFHVKGSMLQARARPCNSTMPADEGGSCGTSRPLEEAATFGQLGPRMSMHVLCSQQAVARCQLSVATPLTRVGVQAARYCS